MVTKRAPKGLTGILATRPGGWGCTALVDARACLGCGAPLPRPQGWTEHTAFTCTRCKAVVPTYVCGVVNCAVHQPAVAQAAARAQPEAVEALWAKTFRPGAARTIFEDALKCNGAATLKVMGAAMSAVAFDACASPGVPHGVKMGLLRQAAEIQRWRMQWDLLTNPQQPPPQQIAAAQAVTQLSDEKLWELLAHAAKPVEAQREQPAVETRGDTGEQKPDDLPPRPV